MHIEEWFQSVTGGESQRTVAQKVNVQQSKLSRQIKAGELDPELIRDISRAYGVKPVDSFLATGFLEADDVNLIGVELALGIAKNSQLWVEMSRRSDPEARRIFRAEGQDDVIDLADDAPGATVFDLPTPDVLPLDEDVPHAASTAAMEPEEGDDDYHGGA